MRQRVEFWLDDEKLDHKQLLSIIDGMKNERLFSQSLRFGLTLVDRLQAHYKQKEQTLCYNLEKLIDPNEAAEILIDYLYGSSQPTTTPQPQREAVSLPEQDFSDFNETGLSSGEGDNFDALFGLSDSFLD